MMIPTFSKGKYKSIVFCLSILCLLTSCVTQHIEESPIEYEFNITEEFEPYCDLVVILDASASMGEFYRNELKIKAATNLLKKINDQLSLSEIPIQLSFITIGRTLWPFQMKTDIVIPLRKYDYNSFKKAIDQVRWTGGKTPLGKTITSLYDLLSKTSESLALLIISDAEKLDDSPVFAVESLKLRFSERFCVHTIQIGNSRSGTRILKKMSTVSKCGIYRNIDEINDELSIQKLVKDMIYYGKGPVQISKPLSKPSSPPDNMSTKKKHNKNIDTWDEYK